MESAEGRLRKWGRSVGIVIPKSVLEKEHLKVNDKVNVLIRKDSNPIKTVFGTLKFKKSTQKMLEETDRELWND